MALRRSLPRRRPKAARATHSTYTARRRDPSWRTRPRILISMSTRSWNGDGRSCRRATRRPTELRFRTRPRKPPPHLRRIVAVAASLRMTSPRQKTRMLKCGITTQRTLSLRPGGRRRTARTRRFCGRQTFQSGLEFLDGHEAFNWLGFQFLCNILFSFSPYPDSTRMAQNKSVQWLTQSLPRMLSKSE
jgi:hypothetical protein